MTGRQDFPLRRSSVVLVVAFTILTLGIYSGFWYLRRLKGLNTLSTETKLPVVLPIALIASTIAFRFTPPTAFLWWVFRLALWLTAVGTAFRVRWMLVEHLRSRISAVLPMSASIQEQNAPSSILTFFLNIWYLQYKINELVESDAAWQEEDSAPSTI